MTELNLHSNGHAPPPHMLFAADAAKPVLPSAASIATPFGPVTIRFVTVDPALARSLLDSMTDNRAPHRRQVEQLTRAMRAGDFEFNGEPLIIAETGAMIDGQHRCLACVASGESFDTLVVSGIRPRAFDTIDQSSRRTAADVLKMGNVPNATTTAAAVRLLWAHKHHSGMWNMANVQASPREIEGMLAKLGGSFTHHAVTGAAAQRALGGAGSFLAAMHYLFWQKDAAAADSFFASLISGANLPEGDPILLLRRRLDENAKTRKGRLSMVEMYAMFVNAWNATRRGRKLTILRGLYNNTVPAIE